MGGNPHKEVTGLKLFSKIAENKAFSTTECVFLNYERPLLNPKGRRTSYAILKSFDNLSICILSLHLISHNKRYFAFKSSFFLRSSHVPLHLFRPISMIYARVLSSTANLSPISEIRRVIRSS